MGNKTGIEWTNATWNPIRGCSRVSQGCVNCYAESVAYRFSGEGQPYEGLVQIGPDGNRRRQWNGRVEIVDELDGLRMLDWVIVGGESGPGARPMHPDWARELRDQCQAAGVPFFFKQWGEWAPAIPKPSETPGRYAIAPIEYGGPITQTDHYPRQFNRYGSMVLERIGKKLAGDLLDGREWHEFPLPA